MTLYIVATPIGNLEDITLRALRILREVNFILSEDTRVTKKLLNHYEIQTSTISFHEHSNEKQYQKILDLLLEGNDLALVSDAGTPIIADPGSRLINFLRQNENLSDLKIIPIPGPSALTATISASGLNSNSFYFAGFVPKKKGRQTFFKSLSGLCDDFGAVIFFESSHRIIKTIEAISEFFPEAKIHLAKELTKIYETVLVGNSVEILDFLRKEKHTKGEFVVIVE